MVDVSLYQLHGSVFKEIHLRRMICEWTPEVVILARGSGRAHPGFRRCVAHTCGLYGVLGVSLFDDIISFIDFEVFLSH